MSVVLSGSGRAGRRPRANGSFPSSLPTQDGSCNGLQHYAALGRDLIGAISVNLMPCSVPQDVYSAVAQQVRRGGGTGRCPGLALPLVARGQRSSSRKAGMGPARGGLGQRELGRGRMAPNGVTAAGSGWRAVPIHVAVRNAWGFCSPSLLNEIWEERRGGGEQGVFLISC